MPAEEWIVQWPTLWIVSAWIEAHCRIPDGLRMGAPFELTHWQDWCTLNHYRVTPGAMPFGTPYQDELGSEKFVSAASAFFYRRSLILGPQKALALDTLIASPGGWATMGDVRVGDIVFDMNGRQTRVVAKSQVWSGRAYRVSFSDGSSLVASGDHEWVVDERTRSSTYESKRLTTSEMAGRLLDDGGARRFRVAVCGPIENDDADLPIDPYVLGVWLGHGELGSARVGGTEEEIFSHIDVAAAPDATGRRRTLAGLVGRLRAMGLLGNKHVPPEYLRASRAQRWSLLQGLMDTDGHADARGRCEFTTVHERLSADVRDLLWSLGIKNACYAGEAKLDGRVTGPKYRVHFAARAEMPVFRLSRKQDRLKPGGRPHAQYRHRRIVAIDDVGVVPTQCITVDSASHTFLAGREMIPTGNCGKGPWSASVVAAEGVGPVVLAGWAGKSDGYACSDWGCGCGWEYAYERGEAMGRPWPTPLIQLTATSEDQIETNVYGPLKSMIEAGPLADLMRVTEGFIAIMNTTGGGEIVPTTASAASRLGNPVTFVLHDENGLYTKANKLLGVADTQRRGAAGMGGRSMATTNCYDPSEASDAQVTFEGQSLDVFKFYEKPPADLRYTNAEHRHRIHAINYAGSPWVETANIDAEAAELIAKGELAQAERFFGNRIVSGSGSWMPDGLWDLTMRERELAA